jgi:thiosulfate/3-mercaptopyruvate sulfurtransferase
MKLTTLIDAATLQGLAATPGILAVDCRFDLADPAAGRRAYLAGHIPGAVHADLNHDLSAPIGPETGRHPLPSPAAFAERAGRLGIGSGVQVIAYDAANGSFAARLWWMLRWVGHEAVAVLDGGLRAWRARGGAIETGEVQPIPRRLELNAAVDAVLDTAAIESGLGDPGRLIVDARAPERFSGAVEPIDPVAGHLPGAVNHPFSANLGGDERFLPADELRARWLTRLEGRAPAELVAMCGSGVTACHDLLSLEIAGLPGARLYAGSWSEWIRDPRRPIERG